MDLFELQAVLRLNADQYNQGIADAESSGTGFIERVGNAWTSLKGKIQTVTTVLRPVIDLIESSVENYGKYQQLSDGVRLLFGDATDTIIENAKRAYRTAGVSMNDYLDMVTSMSGAMLRALSGDTVQATDLIDMAMQDMADNVNAFGTNAESVQAAYRGLARQTYTMLDNLRLGYSGTAQGMFELMTDAAELNEDFAASAEFSMDANGHLVANYADMVRAIHIIQQSMGITGTTEREAATTITGSLAAVKAAWENLQTTMANPHASQADRDLMVEAFTESLSAFLDNIEPVIETVLHSLFDVGIRLIPILLNQLGRMIPQLAGFLADLLNDTALWTALTTALVQAIVTGLAGLLDILITGLISFFDPSFRQNGSAFTQWGVYDWISRAFNMITNDLQYTGGLPNTEDTGPTVPNGAPAPNTPNNPTYAQTSGNIVEDAEEREAIMEALMEMYGFSGANGWRALFGANESDIDNDDELLRQLGFTNRGWGNVGTRDWEVLSEMMAYVNTLADMGDMEAAARQMNRVRAAVRILNEGGDLETDEAEASILDSMLSDEDYAAIINRIRGIDEALDEATADRIVNIGFQLPRGRRRDIEGSAELPEVEDEDGSFASGLWSVPYDDYMARLHRDEMILTASQARDYREGRGGSSEAVVAAIEGLRNDMQHLQMVVGESVFGQTVVNYSGRRMSGYLGEAEDKAVSGYGWG